MHSFTIECNVKQDAGWVYLASGNMRHGASTIIGGGALRVDLSPIVKLSMILGLLILWCWCITASLHGLIAILRLSPKLVLPVGLLTIPSLWLFIALLVLLRSTAAATAARHQILYFCGHLVHEASVQWGWGRTNQRTGRSWQQAGAICVSVSAAHCFHGGLTSCR